jgi:hypothetical protein
MTSDTKQEWKPTPAYEGNDMAGFVMERGFKLHGDPCETIKSITNVRDTAIIVTDWHIYLIQPARDIGFSIQILAHLRW